MSDIVEIGVPAGLSFNQRWNSILAAGLAGVMLFFGLTMRNGALNAVQVFEDLESGVRAQVPAGWLIDNESEEFVFRALDPGALPFKTQLEVAVMPVGPDMTPSVVLNLLKQQRSARVTAYREISRMPTVLREDPAIRMEYAYVSFERNPFQQSEPIVVKAVDVVVLQRGQAVILTYREQSSAFEAHLYHFDQLIQTVEIF